jgi:hypothetical protein
MKKINRLRQLKYPKEFRIYPAELHPESLKNLEDQLNNLLQDQPKNPNNNESALKKKDFYAEVSVGVWRLRKKMINSKNQQPLEEMSRAYRHLESIMVTLENEGIEIQDHDGQDFDAGLSIKVLAFQPEPGIQKETVLETIKPSVYYNGEHILMGEVIVGTPIK